MDTALNVGLIVLLVAAVVVVTLVTLVLVAAWVADGKRRRLQAERARTEAQIQMQTHLALQRMYEVARTASRGR